jgi:GT2 family glycosyltransferase/glycosyltransferase involved in cell wall biosynthesis
MKPTASPARAKRRPKGNDETAPMPDAPAQAVAATLAFEGTAALIRLTGAPDLASVTIDGVPLPRPRWRFAEDGTLRVACPATAFDAQPHTLRLLWDEAAAAPPLELPFRSEYRGGLDSIDDLRITGWIYDTLRPDSSLTLEVVCGTAPPFAVLNTLNHPVLADEVPGVVGGGFEILPPPRRSRARAEMLRITVRGCGIQPFGKILRGVTLPGAVAAATAAGRALGLTGPGLLYRGILLPAFVRALGEAQPLAPVLEGATLLRGSHGLPRAAAPRVDVVIPVYRGLDETLACVRGVLDSGDRVGHRVVVIDDCSPEPDLSAALRALATDGRITYLRNETNLGFVATANRGLALDPDADVLLLNADTLTPPGFLDRLYRAAYSDPGIGTATPLSNNATICSLPLPPGEDGKPYGLALAELDAVCAEVNAGATRDIPTAHGFCMYIKRAALDDVGLFDAERFGAGYGEENDFSLRAFERGWRNVCAADVYVEHLGAVSFADTRTEKLAANLGKVEALYPYYHDFVADFLRTDPLHDLRNRVQKAVWKRSPRIALFVTLSLEGGAVRHMDDIAERLTGEGFLVLALAMGRDADGHPMPVIRRCASPREEALRYPAPAPITEAMADILELAPGLIHVQHLIDLPDGFAEFIRDCGIPYAVTLHDFFYACPKVTLIDEGGGYCGMPPAAKCTLCVRHGPIHPHIHSTLADYARVGETWRGKWEPLLRDALQLIAPSHDTAARYATLFPDLTVDVRPHFASPRPPSRVLATRGTPPAGAKLRVAVPGAIGPQKGARQLEDLARHCSRWDDDILLVVVGRSDRDEVLRKYETVRLPGDYKPGEAVATLVHARCRVALFLSVFPETYSYTLSESLEAGLVPVAYDFGALGERLRALGVGVLVPLGAPPDILVKAIRHAATLTLNVAADRVYGSYHRLIGDYYAPALTDLAESIPPPDLPRLLTWPANVHRDRWCGAEIALQVWSPRPILRLMLAFWAPKQAPMQAVEISCGGVVVARAFLDEGRVKRVVCPIPGEARFIDIACRFDFIVPLAPPDIRSAAAMFSGIEVSDGGPWQGVELPDFPARAPPRPAAPAEPHPAA